MLQHGCIESKVNLLRMIMIINSKFKKNKKMAIRYQETGGRLGSTYKKARINAGFVLLYIHSLSGAITIFAMPVQI